MVWSNDSSGSVQSGVPSGGKGTPPVTPPSNDPPPVYVLSTRAVVGIVTRPSLTKAANVCPRSSLQRNSRRLVLAQSVPTQNSMLPVRSMEVRLAKPLLVSATYTKTGSEQSQRDLLKKRATSKSDRFAPASC